MRYFITLLFFQCGVSALASTNFQWDGTSPAYWTKEACEKEAHPQKKTCFPVKPEEREISVLKHENVENCEDNSAGNPVCRTEQVDVVRVDEAKKAVKEAKEKADKEASDHAADQCRLFTMLVGQTAIDSRSKPEDVQEVTRRLLGKVKWCGQ